MRRLLTPRHVAVVGGAAAGAVIRQCRRIGFTGQLWPVNPGRSSVEDLPCFPDVAALPEAPDAAFVGVPASSTVDVVRSLADRGAGGIVCHASGFAEAGAVALQRELVEAAGGLPLIGPNCIGLLNLLDGVALWPDEHGGDRVASGVAILSQSGNIGQNLTMQRRSLPVAYLVTIGNAARTGIAELIDAMVDDGRVTAIGLYLEGIDDPAALAASATRALRHGVPVVALKSGRSAQGARANLSHTSSLSTPDVLCDALFARSGIARAANLASFVEILKFLHVHGPLTGSSIASASCSGGEAALVADEAAQRGVTLPEFPVEVRARLGEVLGRRVSVANPLDYQTYVWGDHAGQTACFTALLSAGADNHLLVLDFPRGDRCDPAHWRSTVDAFVAARRATGAPASVVSTLPEGLPDEVGWWLLAEGIAPMQGLPECLDAIDAAALIGQAREFRPLLTVPVGEPRLLDEWESKRELAAFGVPVPEGRVVAPDDAADAAAEIGYPVVLKAVAAQLVHKTEAGAVRLDLRDAEDVRRAAKDLGVLSPRVLVERMATGALAELIVGVRAEPGFGMALTMGSGGVLVELVRDTATLLLPVDREQVRSALLGLRVARLLTGFRGAPPADLDAIVDAVLAIARYATEREVRELDVNPLLVFPDGVLAVDAVIS
ncbi:acetate--CoA ligase family protein [Actinophytocola sp.]|uniref:acetate--CoA ligase family protein n=1 Tax=Actinophytocola sp. TaxID=1872138 RepID=UPI002ED2635D